MAETPSFEIPPELREMAEKNVEQARAAYGQFMDFMTQAIGAWQGSAPGDTPGLAGFKVVQDKAVTFAKEKDVQEVLTLQSRYAQTQMQTFGIQAQQLSWLMADALRNLQAKG